MNKLIATSVVRGSDHGDSEGGVYIIDLEGQEVRQVIDLNTGDIDWQGRGGDRGLRGIAIDGEVIYLVASDELFAYSRSFELIGSWRNTYLKHAREMSIYERSLYIVSAACDSVLAFNLDEKRFFWAMYVDLDRFDFSGRSYDPHGDDGPLQINKLQLNSVCANDDGLYVAGAKSESMLHFNGETVYAAVTLPEGVHNAQPFRDGVIFNDSEAGAVRYASRTGEEDRALKVPSCDTVDSTHSSDAADAGRQGNGRGLRVVSDRIVVAGSSPATVAVHDLQASRTLLTVNLSMDARSAIAGIDIWPFQ